MSEFDKYKNEIPTDVERPKIPLSEKIQAKNREPAKPYEPASLDGSPSKDVEQFLISFLRVTPFFNLFEYIAGRCYSGKNIHSKLVKFKSIHPVFFCLCIHFDFALRTIILLMLLIISGAVVHKILK